MTPSTEHGWGFIMRHNRSVLNRILTRVEHAMRGETRWDRVKKLPLRAQEELLRRSKLTRQEWVERLRQEGWL
jgi:hypothetical protein